VAIGPIFIACLVFEASRSFFFGWLRQGVNYLILFALIITIFEMILSLVADQWGNITGQSDAEMGGMLFTALCVLGAIFFLQTPNIAAGIAGGAAAGIGDFYNAGRSGAKFSAAVGMGAAKLGYRGMKAVGSHMGGGQGGSVRPAPTTSRNGHPRR
jgi:type IV secretion system protein VirB6